MIIKFPRGITVNINNVPDNFEEQIAKSFKEYTEGTAKEYTYQDKLLYIDLCRKYLHDAMHAKDCVMELIKDYFEYQLTEYDEIPDKDDYWDIGFFNECFEKGRTNLYDHYTGDHHKDDKIMKLLERAIKVVINWERE